jgi:uncharacterized membrane protein
VAGPVVHRYKRDGSEFDRAIAFIDATFAVALTLLVTTLDLESDPAKWDSLSHFYESVGTQLVAFAISFVVIAGYWLAHYQMIESFVAIDLRVIVANLVLLAAIVLLPFTSEYAGDPSIDHLAIPTVVLAVDVAAVSGAFTVVYLMGYRRGLLRRAPSRRECCWTALAFLAPAVVFLASIAIAIQVGPEAARLSWLSLVVVNPVIGGAAQRAARVAEGDGARGEA